MGLVKTVMLDTDDQGLTVRWPDGSRSYFHHVWLRNCCYCPECGSVETGTRFLQPGDVPGNTIATRVALSGDGRISITWQDGHVSAYDLEWLRSFDYSRPVLDAKRHRPRTWDGGISSCPPVFDFQACRADPASLLDYMRQVRDFGFSLMRNGPVGEGAIETVAGLVGSLADSAYGQVFDLKPDFAHSIGNTFHSVPPHTDEAFLYSPPGIMVLYCVAQAEEGGETVLVDGFHLADQLKSRDREAFDVLKTQPQTFMRVVPQDGVYQYARARVLTVDEYDNVVGIRFHTRTMAPLDVEPDRVADVHRANSLLCELMMDPRNQARFRLNPGEAVVFDNHRVMHARTAFSDARRHFQICNVSRERFHQKLRFTASEQGFHNEAQQLLPSGAIG